VIAREHGCASWPALVHRVEASVESFVIAATSRHCDHARRLLDARPEIAGDRWARLVLGRAWDGEPNEVAGSLGWPPLHYVCHSCFASVELARELLERGADPNAYFSNEYGPMSVLFGAAGVFHDPELTRVLLEHGADPNGEPQFGDALYHSSRPRTRRACGCCWRTALSRAGPRRCRTPWITSALSTFACCSKLGRMRTRRLCSSMRFGEAGTWNTSGC
jgi:hypothetical protein